MSTTRRAFLKGSAAAAALAGLGLLKPRFAFAANAAGNGHNVFYIFLRGGADPLALFPMIQGQVKSVVQSRRSAIWVTPRELSWWDQAARANSVGVHPKFADLISEIEALGGPASCGMSLINEVGITSPDGSHKQSFSHDIATTQSLVGTTSANIAGYSQGFIGALCDAYAMPFMSVSAVAFDNPLLYETQSAPRPFVLSSGLGNFTWTGRGYLSEVNCGSTCGGSDTISSGADDSAYSRSIMRRLAGIAPADIPQSAAWHEASESVFAAMPYASQIAAINPDEVYFRRPGSNTLTDFSNQLRDVARFADWSNSQAAPEDVRGSSKVFAASLGGWDTHTNIVSTVDANVAVLSAGIKGLVHHLASVGLLARSSIIVDTEFGRTIAANGSSGTDHGGARKQLIIGGGISSRVIGPEPSLTEASGQNYFSCQVPPTTALKSILRRAGFNDARLGSVFAEALPGESVLEL